MRKIIEHFKFSAKKTLQYRANLFSWVLADISLYTATFMGYYLLTLTVGVFGDYSRQEVLLYISCSLLVNNIYAVFFAEAESCFGNNIINGYMDFDLLKPMSVFRLYILRHINIPAGVSTPFLVALNIYCINISGGTVSILYLMGILLGAFTMGMMFFILIGFTLFGIRSEELSSVLLQLISINERPDTVFPKGIRNFFVYVIPVFLFSAIPTRIALNRATGLEIVWMFIVPIMYYAVFKIVMKLGMKKYKSGVE